MDDDCLIRDELLHPLQGWGDIERNGGMRSWPGYPQNRLGGPRCHKTGNGHHDQAQRYQRQRQAFHTSPPVNSGSCQIPPWHGTSILNDNHILMEKMTAAPALVAAAETIP
jgi:hypothetical protein